MTTLHLSAADIAGLTVGDDGSVTVELTDEGLRAVERIAAKRASKPRGSTAVQIAVAPRPAASYDDGFAAGIAVGRRRA
jgi:hypothetical protein